MKMKRLLAWLMVLILCFTMVACKPETKTNRSDRETTSETESEKSKQKDGATPLLYRVTDKSGNTIWLFGSIHVGREDYYPLPDYVQNAFNGADALAVELDLIAFEEDLNAQMEALVALIYQDGTTIQNHIPAAVYNKAVEILTEENAYMTMLDMYCPAFWSSMLDSLMVEELGGNTELGIDRFLLEQAKKTNKEIQEVESAAFQYQMMADFDDEIQTAILESSIKSYEDKKAAKKELQELMDMWASGKEKAFRKFLASEDEDMTPEEKQLYARYNKIMVTDRNLTMTTFAEKALASGKEVFICVGAAHVVGENAMAELLEQRGYTVECITK